jgi:hypothetical protein
MAIDDTGPEDPTDTDYLETPPGQEQLPKSEVSLVLAGTLPEFKPFAGAGGGAVTEDEAKKLAATFPDEVYDVRPADGALFIPQVHYRRRLNEVFRPLGWAMVPMSEIARKEGLRADGKTPNGRITFIQSFHMIVRERFAGSAWGEQDFVSSNDNVSEATALEGTKSNALVRCCKDLGIGSECWDKPWAEAWKTRMAVRAWCEPVPNSRPARAGAKGKFLWRRKDSAKFDYPWKEK